MVTQIPHLPAVKKGDREETASVSKYRGGNPDLQLTLQPEGLARGDALSYEKTEVRLERRWTCHVSPIGRLGMTDENAVWRRRGTHHFW